MVDVVSFNKISIVKLIVVFVGYIVMHSLIGVWNKNMQEKLKQNPNDEELKSSAKFSNIVFKWFPALAIILVIFFFYTMN